MRSTTAGDRSADDVVVAIDGWSARSRLQSADVILGDVRSHADGRRWTATTLAGYPGCAMAGVRHDRGRWCLLAIRDLGTVLIRTHRESLDSETVRLLARACYLSVVTGRPTKILHDLRALSPVSIRATFVPDVRIAVPAGEDGGS